MDAMEKVEDQEWTLEQKDHRSTGPAHDEAEQPTLPVAEPLHLLHQVHATPDTVPEQHHAKLNHTRGQPVQQSPGEKGDIQQVQVTYSRYR